MKKFPVGPFINRFGIWGFPLVSAIAVPIALTQWTPSNFLADQNPKAPPLPPLSQLQPSSVNRPQEKETNSPLKKPQPKLRSPEPEPSPQASPSPNPSNPAPKTAKTASPPPQPLAAAPVDYQPPPLEIRVAILRDAPGTTIGVSGQATVADRNNQSLKTLSGNQGWSVSPNGSSLSLGTSSVPGVVWLKPSQGSLIYVGDRWYRGKILLVSQGNSLLVVNYVNLEQYLYSVVGSEMHANAPTEALKAQAIAARSYA